MGAEVGFGYLLEYTEWERQKWLDWMRKQGEQVLQVSTGPHADSRRATVGELVRHIFSGEKRYIDKLSGRPLTDAAAVASDSVEALFRFGAQSRADLKVFIAAMPTARWDALQEEKFFSSVLIASPRKIVTHILLHEVRHWAQIATMFRFAGLTDDFHDFLFSPVMGGGVRRGEATA